MIIKKKDLMKKNYLQLAREYIREVKKNDQKKYFKFPN